MVAGRLRRSLVKKLFGFLLLPCRATCQFESSRLVPAGVIGRGNWERESDTLRIILDETPG